MPRGTELSRTFGHAAVDAAERELRIRRVFEAVASRYDLMNDLMSFGIHRLWKRRFVALAAPRAGQHIVDLAGGTGDVAALMAGPDRKVTVIDPSEAMMDVGRAREEVRVRKGRSRGPLHWLAGVAEALPLADGEADTLTISFGIRNATHVDQALLEAWRVLKPGGRFLCLEFSTPAAWLRPFYRFFSLTVIPRLGARIANSPEAYTYLVESIQRFPDQQNFARMIEAAGFLDVHWRDLSFGIASIHVGRKP
jgi:demethylmenaquinone methyltransferase / 2-methoxy-6-polyprenyl-1,4-benzoquinol methylase